MKRTRNVVEHIIGVAATPLLYSRGSYTATPGAGGGGNEDAGKLLCRREISLDRKVRRIEVHLEV